MKFRRGSDKTETLEFEQKHVGRGINRARSPIDFQRRHRCICREPLGSDHLNNVAAHYVLLGSGDICKKLFL